MKVTIKLDDENWTEFRAACLLRHHTASEVIDRLIRAKREEWKKQQEKS